MASAAKRSGRATTEGKVNYRVSSDGKLGVIVAIGCEAEPVSWNDEFLTFAKKVLEVVEAEGPGAEAQLEEERLELCLRPGSFGLDHLEHFLREREELVVP